jgi:SAM-dependent methyltransferase
VTNDWISGILGGAPPEEGESVTRHGRVLVGRDGLTRDLDVSDAGQKQTGETFAFKWAQRDTYASPALRDAQIAWQDSRYGARSLLDHLGVRADVPPIVLDAGAGSGFSASLLFRNDFDRIRYVGADVSNAIDIARTEIGAKARDSFFLQGDLMRLPFAVGAFDIVLSEGVMHHTPSTRDALLALAKLIRQGGIFAFYVYAKKAPIREFTDDFVRAQLSGLAPADAWKALEPLTRLGIALGELKKEIDVPEDIPLLGIKKGPIDIQRLFYWAICKAYYRPDFTFDEMNHINFDWFAPTYSHRQTPDEVSRWCQEAGLVVEHMKVEEAGITAVARRPLA